MTPIRQDNNNNNAIETTTTPIKRKPGRPSTKNNISSPASSPIPSPFPIPIPPTTTTTTTFHEFFHNSSSGSKYRGYQTNNGGDGDGEIIIDIDFIESVNEENGCEELLFNSDTLSRMLSHQQHQPMLVVDKKTTTTYVSYHTLLISLFEQTKDLEIVVGIELYTHITTWITNVIKAYIQYKSCLNKNEIDKQQYNKKGLIYKGIDYIMAKRLLEQTYPISCIYLLNLGPVEKFNTFKDGKYKTAIEKYVNDTTTTVESIADGNGNGNSGDNGELSVFKFGKTKDLLERMRQHKDSYGKDILLHSFAMVDGRNVSAAETELADYVKTHRVNVEHVDMKEKEFFITRIDSNVLSSINKKYRDLSTRYGNEITMQMDRYVDNMSLVKSECENVYKDKLLIVKDEIIEKNDSYRKEIFDKNEQKHKEMLDIIKHDYRELYNNLLDKLEENIKECSAKLEEKNAKLEEYNVKLRDVIKEYSVKLVENIKEKNIKLEENNKEYNVKLVEIIKEYNVKLEENNKECNAKLEEKNKDCSAKLEEKDKEYEARLFTIKEKKKEKIKEKKLKYKNKISALEDEITQLKNSRLATTN